MVTYDIDYGLSAQAIAIQTLTQNIAGNIVEMDRVIREGAPKANDLETLLRDMQRVENELAACDYPDNIVTALADARQEIASALSNSPKPRE